MQRTIYASVVVLAFFFSNAFAQTTTPVASTEAQKLTVKILKVEGMVRVREGEDQPWKKAEVGMELSELAEFQTGAKSAVQFLLPPNQVVTLDRLGVVKVLQAISQDGKIKTDLGMEYGRTRFDIAEGGPPHESTIRSASNTLAVRGTEYTQYDQRPYPPVAVSLQGRVEFRDARKRTTFGGAGRARIRGGQDSAAATALADSVVDPSIAFARTGGEQALIDALVSHGATVTFDREVGIPVIHGGAGPLSTRELIKTLPGELAFVARWTGDADLNLGIAFPGGKDDSGQSVYPLQGKTSAGGGRTAFDHRGGENGGMEVIFFEDKAPKGRYSVGTQYVAGDVATVTIESWQNGKRLDMYRFLPTDPSKSLVSQVGPQIPEHGGILFYKVPVLGFGERAEALRSASKKEALSPKRPSK